MAASPLPLNVERWTLNVGRFFFGLLLALALSASTSSAAESGQSATAIQTYLDQLAAEEKLSGVIIVAKDGVPIASKAGGTANRATGAPINLET